MLTEDDAVALVAGSPLFDEAWYSACAGRSFASRAEAVTHWVRQEAPDTSPHPLFEPTWLYPGRRRWHGQAPDPLSFYLSRSEPDPRSPHPLFSRGEVEPLERWLAAHDAGELLPDPLPRAPLQPVVVRVDVDRLPLAVAWARHLHRVTPEATGLLVTTDQAWRRVLTSVVAALPSVRVVAYDDGERGEVDVAVGVGVRPPRGAWLPPLLAAVDTPGVAAAAAALVADDASVAGPLLVGLPFGDLERLDGAALPDTVCPTVLARRVGAAGSTVLAAMSRLPGPSTTEPDHLLWERAGFQAPGVPLTVREGRRALRWSIDIAAPLMGTKWGDWHFARALGAALGRLGQWVTLDHPESRERASRHLDDVVLTIRGLDRLVPPAHTVNLLWVISHPDQVSAEEVATYDAAFAAGTAWAATRSAQWGLAIQPLLQCTDTTRFRPGLGEPGDDVLYVGNSRHQLRSSVAAALATGAEVSVIGAGWDEWLPSGGVRVEATSIPNDRLPQRYASAGLVLNDHWEDMRVEGFVSNRVFDVLATGGRLLTDDVAGLRDVLGHDIPVWRDHEDFARLVSAPLDAHFPDAGTRQALAARVVAEHGFDARAATLLEVALRVLDSRP